MTQTALAPVEEMEFLAEWTPEALKQAIEREKKLRNLVTSYCRDAMQESHHYYNLPNSLGKKPALSKEGALNLCSLFKVTPSPDEVKETFHDDGHYTVRARTHIIGRNGAILATGDGLCTSRESKYAHRWMWGTEVPAHINKDDLKKKEWQKNGRDYVQYQVPNQDLPDIFNTVLKMSAKRALVDAVLKLPLVSELFTQDLDEQIAENVRQKEDKAQTRGAVKDAGNRESNSNSKEQNGNVKKCVEIAEKLVNKFGLEMSDLITQFLEEGESDFSALSEERASVVLPELVEVLNSRLQAK